MKRRTICLLYTSEQGGSKAARDIDELVSEVTGMFAGGRLSDEALDGAMKALNLSLIHI